MFKQGDILCSKYRLERQFNKGGFSSVWLAYDLKAKENFALKIYDSNEDLDEFRKGYNLVVNLTHSNIFKPLSFDIHDGVPFLVMPYCQKGSATNRIRKMSEDEVWDFAGDVAAGLAYLHEEKVIVHQDIKPGNILIDDGGKFMITDFDISTKQRHTVKMTARQVEQMQNFNYGSGTPDYMGPERWPDAETGYKPSAKPMQASDIWSLGATLYELMTGEVPFGETGGAYQRNLCKKLNKRKLKNNGVPEIKGNYSKELKKLVLMCLSKDPWDRPSAKLIAMNAPYHKAPVLHPTPWKKVAAIGGGIAATAIAVVIILLPVKNNDKIYLAQVNNAAMMVKNYSEESPERITSPDTMVFKAYLNTIAEALDVYSSADTIQFVSDSAKAEGQNLWNTSMTIIEGDYEKLESLLQEYVKSEAEGAIDDFSKRVDDMKHYIYRFESNRSTKTIKQ